MVLKSLSQVSLLLSKNLERYLGENVEIAKNLLAEEIINDTTEYVPYDTGKLTKSSAIRKDGQIIAWTADYAEYVYNMPETNNFQQDVHQKATSAWFDASRLQNESKWVKNFERNLKVRNLASKLTRG